MAAILNGGELTLTGTVGDFGFGEYFTHGDVVLALAQVDDDSDLTVFLNSGGGYVDDGAAIYALLSRREGSTNIVIDGVAASAASLIAMAGDTVTMSRGSVMMIHDPATIAVGDATAIAKSLDQLEAYATAFARVYAGKSGKTPEECRAIMKAERWYSPEEAVADGFADETSEDKARPVAAFDYRIYAHAPKRLVTMASKKNWRLPDADKRAATSAAPRQTQEPSMTDKERADALAAEIAELKAQMKSGADAEASAAVEKELEELRAEKKARANADAIMALEEATGREEQAKALAEAGVDAEKAKVILAAAPKAGGQSDELTAAEYGKARMGLAQPGNPNPNAGAATLSANMRKLLGKETA